MSAAALPSQVPATGLCPVLEVRDLRIECDGATLVSSMELSVAAGETVGIVGESGSGKSMTARALIGLLPPSVSARGEVLYGGRNLLQASEREWRGVRGRELGLVMQDPFTMLNPVLRCRRIVEESLPPVHGRRMRSRERRAEVLRRLAEVGIADETVADRYPFQLSGGMRQRVAIAAALARDPKVLIADEPSTALDVTTQREILSLLKEAQETRGMALMLITHDLRVAFATCDRIYVLYAGSLMEAGRAAELEAEPMHPYTLGLLLSEPPADRRVGELAAIPGAVPAADEVAGSCAFAPRCQWAQPECRTAQPGLLDVGPGRRAACVRTAQIRGEMSAQRRRVLRRSEPAVAGSATPIVELRSVHKVFSTGHGEVAALRDVSLTVGESESVGIVGESGSGKTTLARIVVGLETATGGEVLVDGVAARDWTKLTPAERQRLRGAVQIVFQDPYSSLNPMRSVESTLREAVRVHDAAADLDARVMELLSSVGLGAVHAGRKPAALSGGERQRVAIARALAVRPRLLICDEPVSALDVSVQAQILNLFAQLRRERGIGYLFITHDLSIVRQVADRVHVMHRGRVVESGPVDEVLSAPRDPYTLKLIESVPRSHREWLGGLEGR